MQKNRIPPTCVFLFALLALLLAACNRGVVPPEVTGGPARLSPVPQKTAATIPPADTPFPPSPTPPALAAEVNGAGITLAEYQAELARYRLAFPGETAAQEQQVVLNDLVNQVLLAQGAAEQGYAMDDADLQQRIDQLSAQLGSPAALADWMASHGYSAESFRSDLRRQVEAAWMRDQIAKQVPESAEQVHAHQILVSDAAIAGQALAELQAGGDFDTIAARYDPTRIGDLGWFPRGYLPDKSIEEAAFALQPGEYSPVIETSSGYHILKVIERDPQRKLEPEARLALQEAALQAWLETRRGQSAIQVLVSPPS